MNNYNKYERYQRQIKLKELRTTGQDKLFQSKVLVAGAGGLGCPALQYLAAAGVGTIGIIDFDMVELSNLQRQTLYSVEDIGKSKAIRAVEKLKVFNPDIQFHIHNLKLESKNALELIGNYDIVMDGTDNFPTRYLINDACVLLNKPLVYGAILRFEGQAGVFNLQDKNNYKTNYRDLFPNPPLPSTVPSCNEAGVLGVLPGIIGTLQAAEVIKIITGIGDPLSNKILSYNVLNNLFYEFNISPAPGTKTSYPKNKTEFENFDYEWFCGARHEQLEVTADDFEHLLKSGNITVIDVREPGELPAVAEFSFVQIPLSCFEETITKHSVKNTTIFFCQSGKRSLTAAKMLKEKFPDGRVYSLKGGMEEWKKHQLKKILK